MMLDAQVWLMDGQQRRVVRIKGSETEKKDNPIPGHAGEGAAKRNGANLARVQMPNATCPFGWDSNHARLSRTTAAANASWR